jgi:VWFA-related protein
VHARLTAAVCVFVAVATLAAQQAPAPTSAPAPTADPAPAQDVPVIRSGVNLVRVDMYATRNGEMIPDLRPEDIELYEDNVRQTLETFEFVRIVDGEAGQASAVTQQDSRSRIYIVFVDTHTTQLQTDSELRQALLRFLDRTVRPNDLVGLMTPQMSALDVTLGRRNSVISDVANGELWKAAPADRPDPRTFAWENCYATGRGRGSRRVTEMTARRDAKATIDALQDLVDYLRDLREERKAVLLLTAGWPYSDESSSLARGADNESKTCEDDRRALLRLNFKSMLRDVARSANRSNVSFYPVNARRPATVPRDMPGQFRNQLRQRESRVMDMVEDQFDVLAKGTDGLAELNVKEMDRVAARIIGDTSAYYLLGYESTNTRQDARFRTITVKVNRPGVSVRSRPGYGGENVRVVRLAVDPTSMRPLMDSRITAAFSGIQRFDASSPVLLRTSAFSSSSEGASGGAMWVVGELALPQGQMNGARTEVVVTSSTRNQVFSQILDGDDGNGAFDLRIPEEGTLPSGTYFVRVRVLPPRQGPITVHESPGVELTSSNVGLGEPVLWRRGPSVRAAYQRTADPRFRREERLRLEYPTDREGQVTVRLLDKLGQPLPIPVDVSERTGDAGTRWVVADFSLLNMAPGEYAVEVTQQDRTQITAFRLIP